MGVCFKLFGKTIQDQEIVDCTGSAFFVAEHYLLTCEHLVRALSPGDELIIRYGKTDYKAELVEIAEGWDLALLYTEHIAQEEWIYPLDRVTVKGREAIAYGYPHGYGLDEQGGLRIGSELDNGVAALTNANGVTIGFSGGPVCPATDLSSAIGVLCMIKRQDEYGRRTETAGFVPAHIALDLWGKQYGLLEKRYKIKPDAFGSNNFVYSAQKTSFQDPHGYLSLLRGFLEDSRSVLWWAIVGPGGSGKSRLCYELACSLNSNWSCELLRAGQLKKDYLQKLYEDAGRCFLLIADYAYTDTDELGDWLVECSHAQNRHPIRVLLLQREVGKENFGWLERLLRRHGNLIELRYQEDLQLAAPGREDTIAIMRSYVENEGGGQIDSSALYNVLQKVDPGLTRPLFAMFITDAALHGEDPREWDPEKALAYFTRREKDVVDRALDRPEDARAAKVLLLLATIADGFTFDADLLDSKPLCGLREFNELPEKTRFGSRLNDARLADWERGRYTVKPMKPDLLGEYYVLDGFRKMIDDQQQEDAVSALLEVAKEADLIATDDFITRLFTDYETDEIIAQRCCGEEDLFHFDVSWGLVLRADTALLQKFYKKYGTELWLEQYARGLVNAINNQTEPDKVGAMLEELRELHREQPCNDEVTRELAGGLLNASIESKKAGALLDELRELYREQPTNDKVAGVFAKGLSNAIKNQTEPDKVGALLEELRRLHKEQPRNDEFLIWLANGLFNAFNNQNESEKADALLEELRELHREQPGNIEVAGILAYGLHNALCDQNKSEKVGALLEELRELHREQPGNDEAAGALARGLCNAFINQNESEKAGALLEELREVHREQPGNDEVARCFARGLVNAINNQTEPDKDGAMLEELRELHREQPSNDEVTGELAGGLLNAFNHQTKPEKAEALLEELQELHREQPSDDEVAGVLAIGLSNAIGNQTESKKAGALLEELRRLHREQPGNDKIFIWLARGMFNAFNNQNESERADTLLEELRELHRERPENNEAAGALACGLHNALCDQNKSEKAGALLEELRELHREQPGNDEVSIQFANGLVNAIYYQTEPDKAGALLDELRELHREKPRNEEISICLAQRLIHYAFFIQTEPDKAGALLDELRELHREQPGSVEVTRVLITWLLSIFSHQTESENASVLTEELSDLLKVWPEDIIFPILKW